MNQIKVTNTELETAYRYHQQMDPIIERRAEFMFSYHDYDNDRAKAVLKFQKEMDKKISLKQIGEQLDKFILDEKGDSAKYYDPTRPEETVKSASKDVTSFELTWTGRLFKDMDPLKPILLDDPSPLDAMPEGTDTAYRDILDRIKYEDERTDYSTKTLNPDQRFEMALFHSFKQDPFYKHFLYNHLRQFAEDIDEGILNFPDGPFTRDLTDVPKFDRINLYDFRRALPQKEREA